MKTFSATLLVVAAQASGYGGSESVARYGPTQEYGGFQHDQAWGHSHYEPGDIERFDGHHAEIYGADDLAWGPNGYANAHAHSDTVHNWDDQGDAYVCHSCGGHGCTLCGGYGHEHKGRSFGFHGHGLKTGFGVGHTHAYLGKKPRSSYNKYGHGIGGRYTQRWSNGYGGRYGLGHGERYGIAHRWSQYNGYGKGNPSSKGTVMGYGQGANASIPQLHDTPDTVGHQYATEKYTKEYGYDEPKYGYEEPEYHEPEYHEPEYDTYEEHDCYGDERRGATVSGSKSYGRSDKLPTTNQGYYLEFASPNFNVGYGAGTKKSGLAGRGHAYKHEYSNGSGNHSPWNGEVWRHDRGMDNYLWRPKKQTRYHTPEGYSNNQHF
jgi:hypothetical protein